MFLSSLDPKNITYRIGTAASLHQNKEYQDAMQAYLMCVPLDPNNPIPMYHISDCCIQQKDPFRAVYFLKMSLAQAQKNPKKYNDLIKRINLEVASLIKQISEMPGLEKIEEVLPFVLYCAKRDEEIRHARLNPMKKTGNPKIHI